REAPVVVDGGGRRGFSTAGVLRVILARAAGSARLRTPLDTLARLEGFARVRGRRQAEILHGDARELDLDGPFDAVVTSLPERELGAAAQGTSRAALEAYCEGVALALKRAAGALRPGAPVVIVVNDRRELYPGILDRA